MHLIAITEAGDYAQDLSRRLFAAMTTPNEEERLAVFAEYLEYTQRRLASCSSEAECWQELQRMSEDMTFYSDKPLMQQKEQ